MANKRTAAPVDQDATSSTDAESPWVKSHGVTQMVVDVELSTSELAAIDARIHAVMDMEAQVDFHLALFKTQLGARLKKLVSRRLALHGAWKKGKTQRVVDVEVFEDDRTREVTRVRVDTGDIVTKRTLDQKEQLAMFNGSSQYLPECDNTLAKQFASDELNEREELDKLLAEVDWSEIQRSLAEQLGMTIEEIDAAGAGRAKPKKNKKTKNASGGGAAAESEDEGETEAETQGGDNGEAES
jgi:hypothetical protein